jgi:hypothetical protein
MAKYVSVSHIDTCFPEYLTDHHGRDGEYLAGVYITCASTCGEVRDELLSDILGCANLPDWITDDMLEKAVDDELPASVSDSTFDDSLESSDEESPQAWFLLTWEDEEDESEVWRPEN